MPVVPSPWETKVGGLQVQSLPGPQSEFKASLIKSLRLPQSKKSEKAGCRSVVKHLPSMCESLGLIPENKRKESEGKSPGAGYKLPRYLMEKTS